MQTGMEFYIFSALGALAFSIQFRTPRRYLFLTVLVAFCSSLAMRHLPSTWPVGITTLITSLGIGALSHGMARHTRAPAQCFLIPGIIFLVPGTWIYRSFSAAMQGDTTQAATLGLAALTIGVGISFGILLANWIVPSRKTL